MRSRAPLQLAHKAPLYHYAVRLTRNETEAEDLVQETFLRAYRFWHRYEPGTNCKAWLFRILKNVYINLYRKDQKTPHSIDFDTLEDQRYETLIQEQFLRKEGQPEKQLLALLDALQVTALRFAEWSVNLAFEQLCVPEDCLERRAELVTQQREKVGLDAVGDLRFFARFALAGEKLVLDSVRGGELSRA